MAEPRNNLKRKVMCSPLTLSPLKASYSIEAIDDQSALTSGRDSLLKMRLMQSPPPRIHEVDEQQPSPSKHWNNTLFARLANPKKSESVLGHKSSLNRLPPYLHYNLRQRFAPEDVYGPGHQRNQSQTLYGEAKVRMPVVGVRKKSP